MSAAQQAADKYIERGGYVHGERKDRLVEDLLCLGNFVAFHDDKDLHGMVLPREAWAAMCRLLDLHPIDFRRIIRPD